MTTATIFAPPTSDERIYLDNIADHSGHALVLDQTVKQTIRMVIEPTTVRFYDEGDFTIYAVKNVGEDLLDQRVYCMTCRRHLDLPNTIEWAI